MIPYGRHHIDDDDVEAVVKVLRSGSLTQGPSIDEFGAAVARYVGAKYAVAVSSGTAALHLAALAAGVGPGTTLITSPITFVASANAGLYAGARVAFADVDPETVNMSPAALEEVLASEADVRAVIPVHFAGLPCDMEAIKRVADRAGAVVIEDAAHALGATYPDGRKVGSCANSLMTTFSFHPVKAIAAGEGGMITTNDPDIYRRLLRLRSHGINKLNDEFMVQDQASTDGVQNPWYYEMQELGYHYRITDIQCALALSQLKKLDSFIERRKALADRYDKVFGVTPNLRPAQNAKSKLSAHHIYVVRVPFAKLGLSRAQVMLGLRSKGIGTQVHYIPVPLHPVYKRLGAAISALPQAMAYYTEALTIPMFYALTDHMQEQVVTELGRLNA